MRFLGIRSHRTPPVGSRGEDGLVCSVEAAQGQVERDLGGYGGGDGCMQIMCNTCRAC